MIKNKSGNTGQMVNEMLASGATDVPDMIFVHVKI